MASTKKAKTTKKSAKKGSAVKRVKSAKRPVVGLTEKIVLIGKKGQKTLIARIDTGATKGAIDAKLVKELNFGAPVGKKIVKSSHGNSVRPLVMATIKMRGKQLTGKYTVADRSHMKYRMLIGQNILKKGKYMVDPTKQHD